LISPPQHRRRRRAAIVTAASEDDDKPKATDDDESAMSGLARRLANRKYDPEGAKQVLATFEKLGIEDEEQLKKFFSEVSLPSLGGQVGQIFLVGVSSWAALSVRASLANDPDITGPVAYLLFFGLGVAGVVLGLECLSSTLLLGGAVATTVIWGSNPKAFLDAVRESAGENAKSGLQVVDKAAELSRAVGVAQSMFDLKTALGETFAAATGNDKQSTIDRLGAMLTLSKASNDYGFDAARSGLTAGEARELATTFARFDRNGTGKLNSSDLYDLARELGINLKAEDSQAALKMLDSDNNGAVEFDEFVEWYAGAVALKCSMEVCEPVK